MPHISDGDNSPTPRFKTRQLALLVAIGETRSLRQAAERIHLSQPAATRVLHELEDALEVMLFARSRQGMLPTVAGGVMIESARVLLTAMKDAYVNTKEAAAGRVGSASGHLRQRRPRAPGSLRAAAQARIRRHTGAGQGGAAGDAAGRAAQRRARHDRQPRAGHPLRRCLRARNSLQRDLCLGLRRAQCLAPASASWRQPTCSTRLGWCLHPTLWCASMWTPTSPAPSAPRRRA
ncbi:LysR family transcriptional regulator [Polaromonas sp. P1-6]|nr:LysR family transcriptional regulator [Polaromonas sp. P1-6]